MKPSIQIHRGELISPVQSLTDYFREAGVSVIEAAFAHTYFVHPDEVRKKPPLFPERVRQSREYFPGLGKRTRTTWSAGDGREIILDDNSQAQRAWQKYTGRKLARGSGYGVRHIWGNTHNPTAFTAGWNISICLTGLECSRKTSTRTLSCSRQFAKPRGTSTFLRIQYARYPTLSRIPDVTSTRTSAVSAS